MAEQPAVAAGAMTISPDPAGSATTIKWFSVGNAHVVISLFDATGHIMLRRQYQVKAGITALPLTNLATLPNGLYLVMGDDGTSSKNGKLLILH